MLWDVRNSALTWLEFPVHISGMSQSLTASRQCTPTNSSYRDSTIIIKITHTQTEGYRVFLYNSAPTWQFLQQRPSLHLAPWVNIHFMQQFSPSLAHSCKKKKKNDYISSVRLMWSWCWCKITHGWASTVTLFSCLHKTISTLWRIQELQNRKVLRYFAHFYLFINCTIIIIHTYDLFSYVMSKRL